MRCIEIENDLGVQGNSSKNAIENRYGRGERLFHFYYYYLFLIGQFFMIVIRNSVGSSVVSLPPRVKSNL